MSENITFEYDVLILEKHLDSFGHVNNAAYVQLYEEARWDFITRNGMGLDRIQLQQIGPVVLGIDVKFKKELKNREQIKIRSQTKELLNSKIMILHQCMLKPDGKIASEAIFTVGIFDMKERRLLDVTDEWLKAVGVLK